MNWPEIYLWGASITAVIAFVAGVIKAFLSHDDFVDLVLLLVMAMLAPFLVGFFWPLLAVAGSIGALMMGGSIGWEVWERRSARKKQEERRSREPEPDHVRYRRTARNQRKLAEQARKENQPELAEMHDLLASQNEQLADVYGKEPA